MLNRYRLKRYATTPYLQDVIIYANSFCNAECDFCDVPKVDSDSNLAQGIAIPILNSPLYMTEELFEKIINDEYVSDGKSEKLISFLMTEPLLNKKLPQLLEIAKKKGHKTKVTTNGYLLNKKAELICDNLDYLQVSIDGLEELHDRIRGDGFFVRAIDGLKKVREISNLRIEINVTVTPLNYHEAFGLLCYIDGLRLEIDEVRFQFLDFVSKTMSEKHNVRHPNIYQGVTIDDKDVQLSDAQITLLKEQLNKIRNYKSISINKITMKPNMESFESISKYFSFDGAPLRGHDLCYTPFTQLAINTSGDVYWHMRCYNNYKLGNVKESGVGDIFNGEKARYFREEFTRSNMCFEACTRCCGIISSDDVT